MVMPKHESERVSMKQSQFVDADVSDNISQESQDTQWDTYRVWHDSQPLPS